MHGIGNLVRDISEVSRGFSDDLPYVVTEEIVNIKVELQILTDKME